MHTLPMGDDLLPGTDRKRDRLTEKHVNLNVTYRHFVNSLAVGEYPGCQGFGANYFALSI